MPEGILVIIDGKEDKGNEEPETAEDIKEHNRLAYETSKCIYFPAEISTKFRNATRHINKHCDAFIFSLAFRLVLVSFIKQ